MIKSGTKNSEIEYSLFGELHENFTINSILGTIKPKTTIDFEALSGAFKETVRPLYLTVRARDWGSPSLFTDVSLHIYVQDVNDHAPMFEHLYYNQSVPEIIPGGTSVIKVCKSKNTGGFWMYYYV